MRFLADENVPRPSIQLLRNAGFDVKSVAEDAPGSGDSEVLARAVDDERVLITRDRDFGHLVWVARHRAPPGVIYVRDSGRDPLAVGTLVARLLELDQQEVTDHFVVITAQRQRARRLR